MKRLITTLTIGIVMLSFVASLAGALSYRNQQYRTITTARGEVVEVADGGVYRYSLRSLITVGAPWDVVWLGLAIPVLAMAFGLHLRGSVRGTLLFVGVLASFLYKYLLWAFDWAYNPLYLIYVALFSLSLWTLVLVLRDFDGDQIRAAIGPRFPARTLATFSLAVGGLLLLKCLGEIVPTIRSNTLPIAATGYYTLIDQGLDLGLLTPFCVMTGILLLKRETLGYVLSTSALMLLLTIGLSVITGEVMLGLSTGHMNVLGIMIFSLFVVGALALLGTALATINRQRPWAGRVVQKTSAA
jgi:hypothetical protein